MQRQFSTPYSITGLNPYPWIRWWYRLAAPRAPVRAEDLPLKEREFLRRGKLTSIALLIQLVEMCFQLVPAAHVGSNAFPSILASLVILIGAVFLNRARKLLAASLVMILVLEVGMIGLLALPPGTRLDLGQIPFIFLLIQPLLISVLLFPAWGILGMGIINMGITAIMILLLPQTQAYHSYLQAHMGPMVGIPLLTQLLCALICFIVITSLQESMVRADKAEEVTRLQQVMAEQARQELQTKRQLEIGIQEIISALTRFANGDQQARIQLDQGHQLWTVAGSINNVIGRFVRLREQERPMEQTVMALRNYLREVQMARVTGAPLPPPQSGTEVDALVAELLRYTATAQPPQPQQRGRSSS
jgi:hypothetical protein